MRNSAKMEEVSGAVGLGLFAADVVRTVGQVLRHAELQGRERLTLEAARDLLVALLEPSSGAAPPAGLRLLGSSGSGLEALSAVELKAADVGIADFLRPLAEALDIALQSPSDADQNALSNARDLFVAISDAEVSHVSRLSRPSAQGVPLWAAATPSFAF